jgi:hypothetical protein
MLYQDADDKILEKDMYVDLNETERVGSTDDVHIVAQVDRYAGGYAEDGDWTSTRRYYVTRDEDLGWVRSQMVATSVSWTWRMATRWSISSHGR